MWLGHGHRKRLKAMRAACTCNCSCRLQMRTVCGLRAFAHAGHYNTPGCMFANVRHLGYLHAAHDTRWWSPPPTTAATTCTSLHLWHARVLEGYSRLVKDQTRYNSRKSLWEAREPGVEGREGRVANRHQGWHTV